MKAIDQYFPVVLLIMPYNVVLTFESVDECDHSNEDTEHYFPAALLVYLYLVHDNLRFCFQFLAAWLSWEAKLWVLDFNFAQHKNTQVEIINDSI